MRKNSTIHGTVCNSRSVSDQTNGFKSPTGLTLGLNATKTESNDSTIPLFPLILALSAPPLPVHHGGPVWAAAHLQMNHAFCLRFFFLFSKHGKRERGGWARERVIERGGLLPSLFSFLLSLILRRISCAVHREEVPSACRASPVPTQHSCSPHTHTHTRTRAVDHTLTCTETTRVTDSACSMALSCKWSKRSRRFVTQEKMCCAFHENLFICPPMLSNMQP